MTVEEKREAVRQYCRNVGDNVLQCVLRGKNWYKKCACCMNYDDDCLYISAASEEELDRALNLIGDAFYGAGELLPVREAEGTKSAAKVIQLEVADGSALQVAYAICKYYLKNNSYKENALIDLDELTEHIDAYVRAERKALEYKKLAENEGR